MRRGHPLVELKRPKLKTLSQYDFVSPSDSRPLGAVIRALYEDNGIDWRKRVHTVDLFPLAKKIVATTDAIGVMTTGFADRSPSFRNRLSFSIRSIRCPTRPRCVAQCAPDGKRAPLRAPSCPSCRALRRVANRAERLPRRWGEQRAHSVARLANNVNSTARSAGDSPARRRSAL